jgi:hypothetical protein
MHDLQLNLLLSVFSEYFKVVFSQLRLLGGKCAVSLVFGDGGNAHGLKILINIKNVLLLKIG